MVESLRELAIARDALGGIIRISKPLQIAADDGRRLVVLRGSNGIKTSCAIGYINVAAHKVDEIRALQQNLRHPCVVVVARGEVAIVAGFLFRGGHRGGNKCAESRSSEAIGRHGW